MDYWIEQGHNGHILVKVKVRGHYFPKQACSKCGIISDNFPSLRPIKCVVCGEHANNVNVDLQDYLCDTHHSDYLDWKANNRLSIPVDYLREKLVG